MTIATCYSAYLMEPNLEFDIAALIVAGSAIILTVVNYVMTIKRFRKPAPPLKTIDWTPKVGKLSQSDTPENVD